MRALGILLDIEGTTSSLSFVHDVMFPYARRHAAEFLAAQGARPEVQAAACQMINDASLDSCTGAADLSNPATLDLAIRSLELLMDRDAKVTGLKQLQGYIWEAGFRQGHLQAHVFEDVPECLREWQACNRDVRIYSSGSVLAQKLFFGHTLAGDLLPYLRGHYDTSVGSKREATSYAAIARDMRIAPPDCWFASDLVPELDAARATGMETALLVRPGNAPVAGPQEHPAFRDFREFSAAIAGRDRSSR